MMAKKTADLSAPMDKLNTALLNMADEMMTGSVWPDTSPKAIRRATTMYARVVKAMEALLTKADKAFAR
jgi:hypothetical protein